MGKKSLQIFFILILILILRISHANSLNFTGDISYTRSQTKTEEEKTTTWNLAQSYSLSFSKEITYAMDLSGSIRYTQNKNPQRTTKQLVPTLTYNIHNDIFNFNLSGTMSRRTTTDTPTYISRSWDANFVSVLKNFPKLRLFYGSSRDYDDQTPHIVDTKSNRKGVGLSYSIYIFDFFYDFRNTESFDFVSDSRSETSNNFGRIDLKKSFFKNRLSFSLSQQINYIKTESEVKIGKVGYAFVKVNITKAFSNIDKSPEEGELPINLILIDGDKTISSNVDIGIYEYQNIGIEINYEKIDEIFLYTKPLLRKEAETLFQFALYESEDGKEWKVISLNLSYSYNFSLQRFEIEIPFDISAKYVKIVSLKSIPSFGSLYITEIEAYRKVVGKYKEKTTSISKFKNYRTNLDISLIPLKNINSSFTYSRTKSIADPGVTSLQTTKSLGISWTQSRYFSSSFNFSESTSKTENNPETKIKSYSLTCTSSPLDTIDASFGYTKTQNYQENEKLNTSDSYHTYITMLIFPDLDADLDFSYTTTKNFTSGTSSKTFSQRITITARINPKLTLDSSFSHSKTTSDSKTSTSSSIYYTIPIVLQIFCF